MTYSNELYHHGVKGMKWGVRRYQNADGTRTALGKKVREGVSKWKAHRTKKRIASVEKYKTKLLNRAERKSNLAKESAKKHRDAYKDLEKNGKYSKTYQEYIDKEIGNPLDDFEFGSDDETPEEAKERRFNNAVNFGTNFVQRAILMNDSVANRNISELMASHDTRAKESSKRAKAYIAARSDILDIPVSETTKKKDIRKAYKKSYKTNLYRHGG